MGDNISESSGDQHPVPVVEKGLLTPETLEENDECYKSATRNIHVDGQLELPRQPCPLTNIALISAVKMHDIIQGQDRILSDIKESVRAPAEKNSNTEYEYQEKLLAKEIHAWQGQHKLLKAGCDQSAEPNMKTDDQEEINRTLLDSKDGREMEIEQLETGFQKVVEGDISNTDTKVESDAKLLISNIKKFDSGKLMETSVCRKVGKGQKQRNRDSEQGEFVLLDSLHQTENESLILSRNAYDHENQSKDLKSGYDEANETVKETPKYSETERTDRYHHTLSENGASETGFDEIVSVAFSNQIRDDDLLSTKQGDTGKDIHVDSSLTEFENIQCTEILEDTNKVNFGCVHEEHRRNSVKGDENIMKETKVLQTEFDQKNCHKMPEIANTLKDDETPIQYLASQTEGAPKDERKQTETAKTLLTIPSNVTKEDAVILNSVDKEPNVAIPDTVNDVGQNRNSYSDTKIYTQTKTESKIENGKSKDISENDKNFIGNKNVYNIDLDTVRAKGSDEKMIETQHDDQFNRKYVENSTATMQNINSKAVDQASLARNSECQAEFEYPESKGCEEDNEESDSNKDKNSSITTVDDEVHLKDLHTTELADSLKRINLESANAQNCVANQLESHKENNNLKLIQELKGENENVELTEKGICESNMSENEGTVLDVKQGFGEADRNLGIKFFLSRDLTEHAEILHKCLENTDRSISKLECEQSPPAACTHSQMKSQNSPEQNTENNIIPSLDDLLKDKAIKEKGPCSPHVNFSEVFKKLLYKEKHPTLTRTNKRVQALLKRSLLRKKYKPFKLFSPQQIIPNNVNDYSVMPKPDDHKTDNNKQMVVEETEHLCHVLHTSDKDVMKLEYAEKEKINEKREINSQLLNRMKKAMKSLAESKKLRNTTAVELRKNVTKAMDAPNEFSDTSTLKPAVSIEPLISKPAAPESYKWLVGERGSSFSPEIKRPCPENYQSAFEEAVSKGIKEQVRVDTLVKPIRARQHMAGAFEENADTKVMRSVSKVPGQILRKVEAKKKCSTSDNLIDIHPTTQQNVHVTGKPKNVYIINVNNSCPESNTKNVLEINTNKQPHCKDSEKISSRTYQNSAAENQSSKTEIPTVSTSLSQNKQSTSCIVTTENQRRVTTRVNFDSCIRIYDSDSDEEVRGSDTVNSKTETLVGRPGKVKIKTNKNIHENDISKIGEKMSERNVNNSRLFSHGKPRRKETQRKATVQEVGNSISKCAKERLLVKLPSVCRKSNVPLYKSAKLKEKNNKFERKGLIVEDTVSPVQLSKQAVRVDRHETTNGKQSDNDVRTNRRGSKHKRVKGSNTGLKGPPNALQIDIRGNQSKENMMEFVADKLRAIEQANDQTLPKKKTNSLNIQVKGPEAEIIQISSDESDIGEESLIESCNSSDASKNEEDDAARENIIESCESSEESESEQDTIGIYEELDLIESCENSEESESEQDTNGPYEELDDSGVYDDDYYDYEKEEVQRKRGKKCSAASSCYVVLTKLTCIRHQNERVHVKNLNNHEYCSIKCRKLFLKKYVNCTY